jgi:hypothetical protein
MFAGQVPITNLFPIFLFSLLKMSHHYLHHVQDSSSDDANEEDIIATLHAAQAQHEHRSTPCWDGSIMVIMIEKLSIERCIVIIFHKIQLWSNFFLTQVCNQFIIQLVFTCNFPFWCLFAQVYKHSNMMPHRFIIAFIEHSNLKVLFLW